MAPASSRTTFLPDFANRYAAVTPVIPPPTIAISVLIFSFRVGKLVFSAVDFQIDRVIDWLFHKVRKPFMLLPIVFS
jgi:hypothetical protein